MTEVLTLTHIEKSILKTLLYYDVFEYPLTIEEIFYNLELKEVNLQETQKGIRNLLEQGLIFQFGSYISPQDRQELVERRILANQSAQKYLKTARWLSYLIGNLPYVRGVFLSGSLSKNYMDAQSDIDYFVIIKPGRVWLFKAFFALMYKTFLLFHKKYFCINYVVDTDNLLIINRNYYIALEIRSLIPTYGKMNFMDFQNKNLWTNDFLPHYPPAEVRKTPHYHRRGFKFILELILNNPLIDKLEAYFQKTLTQHWYKRYRGLFSIEQDFEKAMTLEKGVARTHAMAHHQRIKLNWQQKMQNFEAQNQLSLEVRTNE